MICCRYLEYLVSKREEYLNMKNPFQFFLILSLLAAPISSFMEDDDEEDEHVVAYLSLLHAGCAFLLSEVRFRFLSFLPPKTPFCFCCDNTLEAIITLHIQWIKQFDSTRQGSTLHMLDSLDSSVRGGSQHGRLWRLRGDREYEVNLLQREGYWFQESMAQHLRMSSVQFEQLAQLLGTSSLSLITLCLL